MIYKPCSTCGTQLTETRITREPLLTYARFPHSLNPEIPDYFYPVLCKNHADAIGFDWEKLIPSDK